MFLKQTSLKTVLIKLRLKTHLYDLPCSHQSISHDHIEFSIIMNRINQYRFAWRQERRDEQINKFKRNIRNLIFYGQQEQASRYECSLCCQDRWIYEEDVRNITQLLLSIFHQRHICDRHIEIFISKTLECLEVEPSIYSKLICKGSKQTRELVYRKLIVFLQIFDNPILLQNQNIWQEITDSFNGRSEFNVKLMDCAYSFNEWSIEDEYDQNWDMQIKSVSFTSMINIFCKYPLLFHNYLQEYPINILLEKAKGYTKIHLLSLIKEIVARYHEKASQTITFLFVGFKSHLDDVRHIKIQLEIYVAELELAESFAINYSFIDCQYIQSVIFLIKNNAALKEDAISQTVSTLKCLHEKCSTIVDEQSILQLAEIKDLLMDYGNGSKMEIQSNICMQAQ